MLSHSHRKLLGAKTLCGAGVDRTLEHLVQPLPLPVVDPWLDLVSGDALFGAAPMTLRLHGDDREGGQGEARETRAGHSRPRLQLSLDGRRHQVRVDAGGDVELHDWDVFVVDHQNLNEQTEIRRLCCGPSEPEWTDRDSCRPSEPEWTNRD